MAWGDIWPLHTSGEYAPGVMYFPLDAGETFLPGEVVRLTTAGTVAEAATRPIAVNIYGISAGTGDTTGAETFRANLTYPGGTLIGTAVPADGLPNTNDGVPVYVPGTRVFFATRNFTSAGAAFGDVAPAQTLIGDEAALALIGGSWGLDISAAAGDADVCRILRVLDARGRDIAGTTLVGAIVVFMIGISQSTAGATVARMDVPGAP